jgi:PAS domain S-box-containing protein
MNPSELNLHEYKILVEKAPIMIWRADLTMGCDYFNDRWLAFTGRSLEQERGNGWADGVHADDLDRCLGIYTEAFGKRTTFEMEYRLRRHDGVFRWIFDRGVPYDDTTGRFAGFIGSCIDVTERVEAQVQLKAALDAELLTLRGLLPICSGCKKIRDDRGYWNQIEIYVSQHSAAQFTHSLCPECAKKFFPDL